LKEVLNFDSLEYYRFVQMRGHVLLRLLENFSTCRNSSGALENSSDFSPVKSRLRLPPFNGYQKLEEVFDDVRSCYEKVSPARKAELLKITRTLWHFFSDENACFRVMKSLVGLKDKEGNFLHEVPLLDPPTSSWLSLFICWV
jgi:hypothetical protein